VLWRHRSPGLYLGEDEALGVDQVVAGDNADGDAGEVVFLDELGSRFADARDMDARGGTYRGAIVASQITDYPPRVLRNFSTSGKSPTQLGRRRRSAKAGGPRARRATARRRRR
jgi:hypothetical protein